VTQPALFTNGRANKLSTTIQLTLGAWVLVGSMLLSGLAWYDDGGGRPKPELYGIWTVTTFTRDGAPLPPLTTQQHRWQRLIIEDPDRLSYQQMDGELVTRAAAINTHTITLSDAPVSSTLTVDRTAPDQLRLSGQLAGHPVTMTLRRLDLDSLPLHRNGFHWIQEYPDFPLEQ
jgi:hypothetical protein